MKSATILEALMIQSASRYNVVSMFPIQQKNDRYYRQKVSRRTVDFMQTLLPNGIEKDYLV